MKAKILLALVVGALAIPATSAGAALPENCERVQGTVTCTTTEGPGNNQGGVGTEESIETKGNATNKSPEEPQSLEDECSKRPANAQGDPIGDC